MSEEEFDRQLAKINEDYTKATGWPPPTNVVATLSLDEAHALYLLAELGYWTKAGVDEEVAENAEFKLKDALLDAFPILAQGFDPRK
jgi:hypothetical protein